VVDEDLSDDDQKVCACCLLKRYRIISFPVKGEQSRQNFFTMASLPPVVTELLDKSLEFIYSFEPLVAPTVVLGKRLLDRTRLSFRRRVESTLISMDSCVNVWRLFES
jgi:hypothetical protein